MPKWLKIIPRILLLMMKDPLLLDVNFTGNLNAANVGI
jgi:hypothetical protein